MVLYTYQLTIKHKTNTKNPQKSADVSTKYTTKIFILLLKIDLQ